MPIQEVQIGRIGQTVVLTHIGLQAGLTWSQAEALYLAGKRVVAGAAEYNRTGLWTQSLDEAPIADLEFRRMGLMVHLLLRGQAWIEAPWEQMWKILKGVYRTAKLIEADDPAIALHQIEDMSVLYVSAAPLGLSLDHRKIDEALKLTSSGIPPLGIVPPPKLIGGEP